MDDNDLTGSKELLWNDDGAESICSSTASITDYVSGAELDPEDLSWVETSIHAGNDSDVTTID